MAEIGLTERIMVDDRDTVTTNIPPESLHVVRQTNGVLRIHSSNGGYLFSLVRSSQDAKVYVIHGGFGAAYTTPTEIEY